jgi:hypothetical protein
VRARATRGVLLALLLLAPGALFLRGLARSPATETRTIMASADSYVSTAHAQQNYGGEQLLRVDGTPHLNAYLHFELERQPRAVSRAFLRLRTLTPRVAGLQVRPVINGTWQENGLTSDNAPPYGPPVNTAVDTHRGWTAIDVTPLILGRQQVDLALTTTASSRLRFRSREGGSPPELVLHLADTAAPSSTPAGSLNGATALLTGAIQDVPGATASRYGVHDSGGATMDGLKIVEAPLGGYLGVYHSSEKGVLITRVATSSDLLTWRRRAEIDRHASQATLALLADRSVLVAEEADANSASRPRTWLRLRHYSSVAALLAGHPDRTRDLAHTRVGRDGAEGTPDIRSVQLRPGLDRSVVELGFHYFRNGRVDRQAQGTLTNFQTWSSRADAELDANLARLGVNGNVGDRDSLAVEGQPLLLVEAQRTRGAPWQTYLSQDGRGPTQLLGIRTAGGSRAFSNPTATVLRAPSGARAIVVTLFVPKSGAASGETGELVYYREIEPRPANPDPVVVAAGDVACAISAKPPRPRDCEQERTARVVERIGPRAVLALGDQQYERGTLPQFLDSYDASWGRFRAITYPVAGNHEYNSAGAKGYFDYFGPVAGDRRQGWYSFDLGAWHLIALNSECDQVGGCGLGSPQQRWLAADLTAHHSHCTLAFWHTPLFSSGTHGSNPQVAPLWTTLYRAGADLVLTGHDHDYERFGPQDDAGRGEPQRGIRQFVVGTGGKSERIFGRPLAPNSEVRHADTHGVLRLELHPASYSWTFEAATGMGSTDSGSSRCH